MPQNNGEGKYKRLKALPRFEEIKQRLIDGQSPEFVARVIQEEMGEYTDVSRRSLGQTLRTFRTEEIGVLVPEMDEKSTELLSKVEQEITARAKKVVNVFEELQWLISVQRYRIQRYVNAEEMAKRTFLNIGRDIDILRETLRDYARLQLETGILKRQPIELGFDSSRPLPFADLLRADAARRMQLREATRGLIELMQVPSGDGEGNGQTGQDGDGQDGEA